MRTTRRRTSRPASAAATRSGSTSKILAAAYDAIDTAQNADLVFRVTNSDRSVGRDRRRA